MRATALRGAELLLYADTPLALVIAPTRELALHPSTVAVLARSEADADAVDASSGDEVLVADHPLPPHPLREE